MSRNKKRNEELNLEDQQEVSEAEAEEVEAEEVDTGADADLEADNDDGNTAKKTKKEVKKFRMPEAFEEADLSDVVEVARKNMETLERSTLKHEQAGYLVKTAAATRPVNVPTAKQYAKWIDDGEWADDGPGSIIWLVIDDNGNVTEALADGQHRCLAVANAEKDLDNVIFLAVKKDLLYAFDSGKPRSGGDAIYNAFEGKVEGKVCKALKTAVQAYETYEKLDGGSVTWSLKQVNNLQAIGFVKANRKLIKITEELIKLGDDNEAATPTIPWGFLAAFVFIGEQLDLDLRPHIERFITGQGIEKGDPVGKVREHLIEKKNKSDNPKTRERVALLFKALNAALNDEKIDSIKKISWTYNGKNRFPKLDLEDEADATDTAEKEAA